MPPNPQIAVVSPFLDKRHGTELCIAEQLERLCGSYEFHLYSMRVEDVDLSRIHWHQIPDVPGPYLFRYAWWFVVNPLWRWYHRRFRNVRPEIVYSPGVNCLDADIISVHIVFVEFHRLVKRQLNLRRARVRSWPRAIHRWLYYHLAMTLESMVYGRKTALLTPVSKKVADDLKNCFGRSDSLSVVYYGVDSRRFCPEMRMKRRADARQSLGLDENAFALLLIGNDWMKKGLDCVLAGVEAIAIPNLRLLVAGHDDVTFYRDILSRRGLSRVVSFLPVRADVEIYYAATDVYAGPSLEDAFAIPPLEAMASGLPVIVSRQAGVSEIITNGLDGFILENPHDATELARLLKQLYETPDLRIRLGKRAALTAKQYSWERNAAEMKTLFDLALRRKSVNEDGIRRDAPV